MFTAPCVGNTSPRHAGFSLVELMITVTIMGILLAMAVPSFDRLIKDNRRSSIVNELIGNAMLARAEAAKRGQPVALCGNTSSGACTGGATWDYGWTLFVDVNGNGVIDTNVTVNGVTYNEANMVLKQFRNDYPTIKVSSNAGVTTSGAMVMMPFGQTGTAASLLVCDDRSHAHPDKARVVCVSSSGRAVSQQTNCTTGSALSCP